MTRSQFDLSICIPSLFREEEIHDCLRSIELQQFIGRVEVIIVSPSADPRFFALSDIYSSARLIVSCHSSPGRASLAQDLLAAIQIASSEFCWVLSDDDVIEPDGISRVLHLIYDRADLAGLSVGYIGYTANLKSVIPMPPAIAYSDQICTPLQSHDQLVRSLGMHLGFLSCQIFRKTFITPCLARLRDQNGVEKNYWIVLDLVAEATRRGRWYALNLPLIGCRTGNDSFVSRLGPINRLKLSYIDFEAKICEVFDVGSSSLEVLRRDVFRHRLLRNLLKLRINGTSIREGYAVYRMLRMTYRGIAAFHFLVPIIFLTPKFILRFLIRLYVGKERWENMMSL